LVESEDSSVIRWGVGGAVRAGGGRALGVCGVLWEVVGREIVVPGARWI
jgi:hypothetical protein